MVPEGWKVEKLAGWLVEHREKSTEQDQHVVLTSSRAGLVTQAQYYGENRITKRSNIGFHVVPPGYLTYRSRSDDDRYYFNRNLTGKHGVVSHFYPVFHFPKGDDQFFYYYLNHFRHRTAAYAVGSSQRVLSLNALRSVSLPIPPLPEQRKIAEILSTWDTAIKTSEKLLANAEAQKRALMQELLTGKRRLKGVEGECKSVRVDQLAYVNPRAGPRGKGIVTFLPMEAVGNYGQILLSIERNIDTLSGGYTAFIDGDVLVAKITPCFENGKGCHAVGLASGRGFGSTEFHVVRAKLPSDERLLFHIVNSRDFRRRGEGNMTGSAGQRRVPADYIKDYSLPLPLDADARLEISRVLDVADAVVTSHRANVANLSVQKRALMQQLLTGKRRVKP